MKERLLEFLRCPVCLDGLSLTVYERAAQPNSITSGLLTCRCGAKYPVWESVPRMIPPGERTLSDDFLKAWESALSKDAPELFAERAQHPAKRTYTFDVEWSMYRYTELTWEVDLPTRVRAFYHFLQISPGELPSQVVLDAGCGNGTFTAALAANGPEMIGMDYSLSVVRAEKEKARFAGEAADRVHYVQGDVRRPPFAPNTFDTVYSDGVLHHTPSTRESFRSLSPLVKSGGRFYVMLYRADAKFIYNLKMRTAKVLQVLFRPVPLGVMRVVCWVGAAILLARVRILHLFGNKKRPIVPLHLRAVNLFDTLTPRWYHLHTPTEVSQWFREEGFREPMDTSIPPLVDYGFGMLGVRARQE